MDNIDTDNIDDTDAIDIDLSRLQVSAAPSQHMQTLANSAAIDLDDDFNADSEQILPERLASSPEDDKNAFETRLILQLYKSKFPNDLDMLRDEFVGLATMSLPDLQNLRKKCDIALGASSSSENKRKLFNSCIYGLEKICTGMGYDTTGSTALLLSDSDFQRDLLRLSLKYLSADETSAELTVGMKLVSTFVQTNANNEIKAKLSAKTDQPPQIDGPQVMTLPAPSPLQPTSANKSEPVPDLSTLNEKYKDL